MLEHGDITDRIIGAAIAVHSTLGPGYIESIYESALCVELRRRSIDHRRQLPVSVFYEGIEVGLHRLDLLIEGEIVVELKAVKALDPSHFSVVRSYLRAVGKRHGLILNFDPPRLEIRRVIAA